MKTLLLFLIVVALGLGQTTTGGLIDNSSATSTKPIKEAATEPSTCTVGTQYRNTATGKIRYCVSTNAWADFVIADAAGNVTIRTTVPDGAPAGTIGANVIFSPNQALNVKAYGAIGDAVTVDTTAIQTALDTCSPVYVPKGTYIVTTLTMSCAGQSLYMDEQAEIRAGAGANTLLNITASGPVYIHGGILNGDSTASRGISFTAGKGNRSVIRGTEIKNVTGAPGIGIATTNGNVSIELWSVRSHDNTIGAQLLAGSNDWTFMGGRFYSNTSIQLDIGDASASTYNVRIYGTQIEMTNAGPGDVTNLRVNKLYAGVLDGIYSECSGSAGSADLVVDGLSQLSLRGFYTNGHSVCTNSIVLNAASNLMITNSTASGYTVANTINNVGGASAVLVSNSSGFTYGHGIGQSLAGNGITRELKATSGKPTERYIESGGNTTLWEYFGDASAYVRMTTNGVVSWTVNSLGDSLFNVIQSTPRSTAPACTTAAHIGKIWFDNTTDTTAMNVCVSVSGTVQWVTK